MVKHGLLDKVVVITGASHGFGRIAAARFAAAGSSVVLAARTDLDAVRIDCELAGGNALPVPTDVRDQRQVEQLLDAAVKKFGRVDVWVNNAGIAAAGEFEKIALELHKDVLETNLLGTFYGCFFALKHFRAQSSGILINIAAPPGKMESFLVSYAAAKSGVIGLSEALRQELKSEGETQIHVCTVMPRGVLSRPESHAELQAGDGVPLIEAAVADGVVDALLELAVHPKNEVTIEAPRYFA